MKIIAPLLLIFLAGCQVMTGRSQLASIREELLRMEAKDQNARSVPVPVGPVELEAVDAHILSLNVKHAERLKVIIDTHGWPGKTLVGADGAIAAWVIVQHSDHDPEFQRKVLHLIEPLVPAGEVSGKDYAYLWDRTHVPQRYGTQGKCGTDGSWVVGEIEAPTDVDARREAAGIFPIRLEDYVEMATSQCRKHG